MLLAVASAAAARASAAATARATTACAEEYIRVSSSSAVCRAATAAHSKSQCGCKLSRHTHAWAALRQSAMTPRAEAQQHISVMRGVI
jgi:hypothetical protein